MSDCKKLFNKDVFAYLINIMPDDVKNELTNCDEMSGGRKKKIVEKECAEEIQTLEKES